jgi:hypothetical protein
VPKFREGTDYDGLARWALLGMAEVCMLTRMSRSKLERMVKLGEFVPPSYHGKDRVCPSVRVVAAGLQKRMMT